MLDKTVHRILIFALLQATGFLPVSSIICQRSECELEKNSEYDCLTRYLVAHLDCPPPKVCTKILIYDSTVKLPRIETKDKELVVGYPLLSVIRKCDFNEQKLPINECIIVPQARPPNSAVICLCNTDFCNGGTKPKMVSGPIFFSIVITVFRLPSMWKCF